MKQRTVPTYPGSAKQVARAALLSTVIADWKTSLSTAEREIWNGLAAITSLPNKLGEQFSPSGLNLFVKSNVMLDLTGQTHVTAAPVAAIAPAPSFTLAHTPATGIRVTSIGNWDNSAATQTLVQSSPDMPLSVNYYKGPWTGITYIPSVYWDTIPALITASADLIVTSRKFYRFRAVHADGSVSAPIVLSADVGAVV